MLKKLLGIAPTLEPDGSYQLFLEQYPDIEQSISNYHIASYLGMTQQSLSRVRAEMARN